MSKETPYHLMSDDETFDHTWEATIQKQPRKLQETVLALLIEEDERRKKRIAFLSELLATVPR
jgi:hypothetical protein